MSKQRLRYLARADARIVGAATVEFALSAMFLFTLMFGMIDFSRWLFAINSAVEATRWGARIAAVCNPTTPAPAGVISHMLTRLPSGTTAGMINVTYLNDSCAATETCMVRVSLSGVPFTPVTWILPNSITLPPLATTLPRESLSSTVLGQTNPDC